MPYNSRDQNKSREKFPRAALEKRVRSKPCAGWKKERLACVIDRSTAWGARLHATGGVARTIIQIALPPMPFSYWLIIVASRA